MIAAVLYALATGFDLLTTTIALHLGLHEGNPIVAPFINSYGFAPQIAISVVLCGVLFWYALRGGTKLVYGLAALRWTVVASNVFQLAQANHFLALVR